MQSHCIMAHVRAASPGLPVVETNCHPFVHERFAFCHNGSVGDFARLRRALLRDLSDEAYARIEGSTDSELLFAMFLDELEDDGADAMAAALARVVRRVAAADAREPSYLNLCVTDGHEAACTRWSNDPEGRIATLYFHQGRRYVCEGDTCRMVEADQADTAAILASEPLSKDPGWDPVPENHVGALRGDRTVEAWALDE
jgi:predicted glutamine amidotransferase